MIVVWLSECCGLNVDVAGGVTQHWVCAGCGQPCDAYQVPVRDTQEGR